jgi:hypothetical protein
MRRHLIGAVAALVLLAAGVTVHAAIPGSDGAIHACYVAGGGQIRVIDADHESCRPGEVPIQWTVAPSCPADTIQVVGVCIETTTRGFAKHRDAELDCAQNGRRLPTNGELTTFSQVPGMFVSGEFTDAVLNYSPAYYLTISGQLGLNGYAGSEARVSYRCVAERQ